ncbi:hypothetical protein BKA67DRAFT_550557 [Truncatella angustata]|uniref:Secreted protein n=1 Tax=Truncatella angustata TaxID=152316 RepID=A0A9P9A4J9_9PEZI|nr:uncharacterized protein BKA67DRAFT_550557 [Truncatella angustata]KAH6661233.1 hypothetical protein BKA67DRAFT_550557 [Truncatella angustata]
MLRFLICSLLHPTTGLKNWTQELDGEETRIFSLTSARVSKNVFGKSINKRHKQGPMKTRIGRCCCPAVILKTSKQHSESNPQQL